MAVLRTADLDVLLAETEGPCVSLYMPTHRTGRELQQDPIRFKNLLRKAEQELEGIGIRGTDAETILEPARRLIDESPFWEHASDGLAMFLAPGFTRTYRLPVRFLERAMVSSAFHVKPLLTLLTGDGIFFVLALSQKRVRVLQGTRFSVGELAPDGMPLDLVDALATVESEDPAAEGGERSAPRYPSRGVASDAEKTDLKRYFRLVDEALMAFLGDRRPPLVLAGVERYLPLYREVSKYWNLVDGGVKGHPDDVSAQDLHARAWAVVEPLFLKEQEDALDRYREGAGKAPTSADLDEIVRGAHHGRVASLFVARGEQRWGAWIPDGEGTVIRHETQEPGDQDLVDLAAAAALQHGGRVFALEPAAMPAGDTPLAAIFRY